jgi:hypothetical protein
MRLSASSLLLLLLSGCASSVVLIPPGQSFRVGKSAAVTPSVYAGKDAQGNDVWNVAPNAVQVPEGWFVVPPPTTQPGH